ncbi:MAG: type II toxin-antitoxin system ParD family antitoxin [Sphingomonas sp.]|uniref:type II toxin-antitoxin system ParD family antitoxin n=1 Tax=Sphingomonas sp. TaxID=28214 RepID=UPI0017ADCE7C|nr:type II toxin-antitoxin system ParD family antitoxin [Sphingomonas sp.]MBA3667532.1 type II toxin-antitoxin system ParD family antitoxin [Sphingomonas sp.]
MATMNISVTDKMRAWVEAKVSDGDYATASDCLRDLVRERMELEAKLRALKHEVREGFESGPSDRSWDQLLQAMKDRAGRRRALG